jgi:hypothetical protein
MRVLSMLLAQGARGRGSGEPEGVSPVTGERI